MSGTAFCASASSAPALMSMVQCQCRSVSSSAGLSTPEAALLTRKSSRPKSVEIFSKMQSMWPRSATLPRISSARAPRFSISLAVSMAVVWLRR